MKTNYLHFNDRELPSYLGYGILDESSIQFENDVLNANYLFECDGSLVHQVNWEKDKCSLQTFCHGKKTRMTFCPNLKRALLTDCMTWSLHEDDCFLFLSKEICNLGNIYVNHPKPDKKQTSLSYYPAGNLFVFSLPLLTRSPAYLNFLEQIKGKPNLGFFRERKGSLLLAGHDLEVSVKPIIFAEFIVPLARLVSAAAIMANAGIIEKEKQFRLMVNEAYAAEQTLMQVFTGDEKYSHFGICFKEFEEEKYSSLVEMFRLQAERLSSLQKI